MKKAGAVTNSMWLSDCSDALEGLDSSLVKEIASPKWAANLDEAKNFTQLFTVVGIGGTKAVVSMHEKNTDGEWQKVICTSGFIGKNGMCSDSEHFEGCGQTPIGVYRFNRAFGIADNPGCAIPYIKVDDNTYWSCDDSMHYNELVNIRDIPELDITKSEHIIDYKYQYQYCLNISFNEERKASRGSAIFLHCLNPDRQYTEGCVAIPENIMRLVMQKVRPDCAVIIDTIEKSIDKRC